MAVGDRVGLPLQHEQADALGPAGAVGGVGVGLAPAVGGEPALPGGLREHVGGGHDGYAPGEGEGALPAAQRLRGQVDRDQRRRARGVNRDGRALEAERIGDAAGDDAGGAAVGPVTGVLRAGEEVAVVAVHDAGEDPGPAAPQGARVDPGPFERFPGGLEQQTLLRVHRHRFARRDPEERGVEVGGVMQEPARAGGRDLPQRGQVPTTVRREGGDGVRTGNDKIPQLLRSTNTARIAARHSDDDHRIGGGAHDGGWQPGCRVGCGQLPAQVGGEGPGGRVVEDERGR